MVKTKKKIKSKKIVKGKRLNRNASALLSYKSLGQLFPSVLRVRLREAYNTQFADTSNKTQYIQIWKGNDLYRTGPATAITGNTITSYANTVPTGIQFFLSDNNTNGGAASPYSQYRVLGSTIKVKYQPSFRYTTGASQLAPVTLFCGPMNPDGVNDPVGTGTQSLNIQSLTTTSFDNKLELPRVKHLRIAANATTTTRYLTCKATTQGMLGYRYKASIEGNPDLDGQMFSTGPRHPDSKWLWYTEIFSDDGLTLLNGALETEIWYDVEFFTRNQPNSSPPI